MTHNPHVALQTASADDVRDRVRDLMAEIPTLDGDIDRFTDVIDEMTGWARSVDANNRLIVNPNVLAKKAAKSFARDDKKLRKKARDVVERRFGGFMLDPGWYNFQASANRAITREVAIRAEQDRLTIRDEAVRRHREELGLERPAIDDLVLDINALMNQPESTPLIEGVCTERSLVFLVGDSGVGKSAFAISMSLAVSSDRDWLGREVTAGKVLYVAGEGGAGLPKRVRAERDAWSGETPDIEFICAQLDLTDDTTVEELIARNAECDYALIVWDTLNRHAGDAEENSATAMSQVIRNIDRIAAAGTRTTSIVLHHHGKSGTIRGSSALYASADTVLELSGEPGLLSLKATKQKDSEGGLVGSYRLKPRPEHDSIIVEGVLPGGGQPTGAQAAQVEEALAHFARVFGQDGVTRPQFVDHLVDVMRVGKSTAQTYVGELIIAGRLTSTRHGARSTYLTLAPTRITFPIDPPITKPKKDK